MVAHSVCARSPTSSDPSGKRRILTKFVLRRDPSLIFAASTYRIPRGSPPPQMVPPHTHTFGLEAFARGFPPGVDEKKRSSRVSWFSPRGRSMSAKKKIPPPPRAGAVLCSFELIPWRREALKAYVIRSFSLLISTLIIQKNNRRTRTQQQRTSQINITRRPKENVYSHLLFYFVSCTTNYGGINPFCMSNNTMVLSWHVINT